MRKPKSNKSSKKISASELNGRDNEAKPSRRLSFGERLPFEFRSLSRTRPSGFRRRKPDDRSGGSDPPDAQHRCPPPPSGYFTGGPWYYPCRAGGPGRDLQISLYSGGHYPRSAPSHVQASLSAFFLRATGASSGDSQVRSEIAYRDPGPQAQAPPHTPLQRGRGPVREKSRKTPSGPRMASQMASRMASIKHRRNDVGTHQSSEKKLPT
jgi:hypothetical protein